MTGASVEAMRSIPATGPVERVLGTIRGSRPGPTLICIGGVHGNEPAGVHALRRVLGALRSRAPGFCGELVALTGNRGALAAGVRFVDRDLNRAWTDARLDRLRSESGDVPDAEDHEQRELLDELEAAASRATGPVYALDLHTTSGPGGVFSVFGDVLSQRAFAARFPVPMILGLEELVDGTVVNFLGEHGVIAVTVETGQHMEPAAIDRAGAAIWVALGATGLLPEGSVPELAAAEKLLRRASADVPRVLEMRYRHPVKAEDRFQMSPGFSNFQRVYLGQVVAADRDGSISAPETARLLMPLYQKQGEDGFFLVREFSPFWMHLSAWLRRLGVDRVAHMLPGVRRVPGSTDAVIVHKRIARFFAKQLFHLLGFRQLEDAGSSLVMRRRPVDGTKTLLRRDRAS